MRIVNLQQRSDKWHVWRRNGIGSSDIAAIVGKSPWTTPYQVWEKLMGLRDEVEINPAMQRGIDYEDEARDYFGDNTLIPRCVEHDHYNYFHASLDGLNENFFIEIKVPSQKNFESYKQCIPEHYQIQMQWQFLVTDKPHAFFIAYSPELKRSYCYEVLPNLELMEELELKGAKFWSDYLNGIAPPLTEKDTVKLEGPELRIKCKEYQKCHEMKRKAEEEMKVLKEEIISFGHGKSFSAYGVKCIKIGPRSSYDMEEMKKDGVDIEKYKKVNEKESFMLRLDAD